MSSQFFSRLANTRVGMKKIPLINKQVPFLSSSSSSAVLSFPSSMTARLSSSSSSSSSISSSQTPAYIADIETRWTKLPECEQAYIADRLAAAQAGDWKNLSLAEKRAAYFIAYGPYGARTPADPAAKWRIIGWTSFLFGLSYVLWRYWENNVLPPVRSQTKEWQEATRQKAIEQQQNPFYGAYADEVARLEKESNSGRK